MNVYMSAFCFFAAVAANVCGAVESGDVVASGRLEGVALDTRAVSVRTVTSTDDLGGFVCNNVEDWARGGDPLTAAASVRITPMCAADASDPSTWEVAGAEASADIATESLWAWASPCATLYRAELVYFDGTVAGTAYFDLRAAAEAAPSLATQTIAADATVFYYDATAQRPVLTVTDAEGNVLREGVDYRVVWPDATTEVGTYVVRLEGIGGYGDAVDVPFSVAWLTAAGESAPAVLDTRGEDVVEIPDAASMRPFVWNTSPAWPRVGGEAFRSARFSSAPMADASAAPDESRRTYRTFRSGDGVYEWTKHGKGFYQVRLEFLTNGVVDASATLTRVVHTGFVGWKSLILTVR